MKTLLVLLCVMIFAGLGRAQATAPVVDLAQFPPDSVWRCANSEISSEKDADGAVLWKWKIDKGGEGFLWLNESLPVRDKLPEYQRLVFDVKFAEGEINQFWPRTVGLLAPPYDKMFCEWNLFYFMHPHKQWITYQQVFNDPSWFATYASQIPADVKVDRTRLLGFACLPKGPSCTVELRNCRLVKDAIRVEKPYLTTPIGWPVKENEGAELRYRTPYFVKNLTREAQHVTASIRSKHDVFKISSEPPEASIPSGRTQRFDVVATLLQDKAASAAPLTEETAVVEFVPNQNPGLGYRTETFCTVPLPSDARRMVAYSPSEQQAIKQAAADAEADAKFWMSVNIEDKTEIPNGVGHLLVYGIPAKCPKCQQGQLHVDQEWLAVKCDHCGHTERHTTVADATWIATWSAIHGSGPSPTSLGRAYLATGDERYAKKAIALLTLLARGYPKLTWHNSAHVDGWPHAEPATPEAFTNGASARWGNTPTYGTNFMVQGLATLHNMIVDSSSWSDAQRELVHQGFWVPVATELMKITPGISNMNDIINRDLILAGLSTNDANLLYRGTLYPTGVVGRMRDIGPDGFSDEGSALNYHLAAMREWFPSIELLVNSNMKFGTITDRAIAALKMPMLRSSLNGVAYCTGNSGQAWFNVPLDGDMFVLADKVFPQDLWPRKRQYSRDPILFRDAGWAILRSGETAEAQVMVNVDYGRSHGHGDLDRMNLGLLAFGVPLSADPGSAYNFNTGAESGPAEGSMAGPFVANTVVIDGLEQLRGAGKLIAWDPNPNLQRITAQITGIYPGVSWRRSVALTNGVCIVIDDLHSDRDHRYELAWHHYGKAQVGDGCRLSALTQPLGDGLYQALLNVKRVEGELVTMDWAFRNVHLRAWHPTEPQQLTYTAQTGVCWENTRGLAVDGLYSRRQGKSTRFVTVLEPYQSKHRLTNVSVQHAGPETRVKLHFADGTDHDVTFDAAAVEPESN